MILASVIFMHTNAFSMNSTIGNQINTIIVNHDSNPNAKIDINQNKSENRFAFVLFYMSTCPHCQRFDPILKVFGVENHIPILSYTLDGNALPSFPNSFTPTKNEVLKFFPSENPVVPTLFLMDQKTHRIYPVLRGEATQEQLSHRFEQLQNDILNGNVNANNEQDFDS
jgi:type-F conjugative transfer system pilin assembly thiol-disulfide isomerase TrbB